MQPLKNYVFAVEVILKDPRIHTDSDGEVDILVGYAQRIGISDTDEMTARSVIESYIVDQEQNNVACIEFISMLKIENDELQEEIYDDEDMAESLIEHPPFLGFWYLPGRAYWTDEDNDDPTILKAIE